MQPAVVGGFELVRPIARGGMGEVWQAVHQPTGHPAAVKLLLDAHQRASVRSFDAEIAAFAALEHPHIVRILDQGRSDVDMHGVPAGSPWLAMELLEGGTAQSIGEQGLRWSALKTLLEHILDGLAHAHARGLVHRDVKPANLLLDNGPYPRWKLGDFGLAQTRGRRVIPAATFAYASPEQLAQGDQGPPADLYSLGAVAWRLATATLPFQRNQPRRPPAFLPVVDVPPGFEAWLRTMLHEEPSGRFALAADARAALDGLGAPEATVSMHAVVLQDAPTELQLVATDRGDPHVNVSAASMAPWPRDWRRARQVPSDPALVGAGLGLFALRPRPMVGRERVRDALWEALDGVRRAGAAGVYLRGAAADGPEHVASWLASRAMELGAANCWWVDAQRPLRSLVEQGAGRLEPRRTLARAGLQGVLVDALVLGVDLALLGPLLHWGATSRPLVVVVPSGCDAVLEALSKWLATSSRASVLVLAHGTGPAPAGFATMALEPLTPQEMMVFVDGLLPLEPSLAAWVANRAQGHPETAAELVSHWLDADKLQVGPTGWTLLESPETVAGRSASRTWRSLHARLLPEEARAVQVLGVLQGGTLALWRAVCPVPDQLVGTLVRRGVLQGKEHLQFVDVELPEAALADLDDGARLQLFAKVADELQSVGEVGALGLCRCRAEQWERAIGPLLEGAEEARLGGRVSEALVLLERAFECLDRAGGPHARVERSVALRLQGWVLDGQGHVEAAAAALKQAVNVAQSVGDPDACVLALRARAGLLRRTGDVATALRCVLGGRLWAEQSPAHAGGLYLELALVQRARGAHDDARLALHDALSRPSSGAVRADVLLFLGFTHFDIGDNEVAQVWFERAREAYTAEGVWHGVGAVEDALGALARVRGDLKTAEACHLRALELQANAVDRAVTLCNIGVLRATQGRFAEAVEALLHALAVFQRARFSRMERFMNGVLLWPLAELGRWHAFDHHAELARPLLDGEDIDIDAATALVCAAEALLRSTHHPRAEYVVALATVQLGRIDDLSLRARLAGVQASLESA